MKHIKEEFIFFIANKFINSLMIVLMFLTKKKTIKHLLSQDQKSSYLYFMRDPTPMFPVYLVSSHAQCLEKTCFDPNLLKLSSITSDFVKN